MSIDQADKTVQPDARAAESPAWLEHLMACYDVVVLPAAANCFEPPPGSEQVPPAPDDYAAVDAIMRYYNG